MNPGINIEAITSIKCKSVSAGAAHKHYKKYFSHKLRAIE
jgi:hypothetical protein